MTSREPSPVLARPGAVDAPEGSPDVGVPLHFGDPLGEQRAAVDGFVVVDRSHRDVLQITGGERLSWLEGFVSQHVSELADGDAAETLVLDANGRVEHHAQLAECAGSVTMDTEAGYGGALLAFLQKMVFWADVAPAESDLAVISLVGGGLPETLAAPDGSVVTLPRTHYHCVALPGGGLARALPWPGAGSVDLLVPRGELTDWFDAAVAGGARPAGSWAYEALRVATSDSTGGQRARLGVDTDGKTIPHEVPAWIGAVDEHGAVHLDKGCYRGQETVAKVHNLGRPPRRLVFCHLDGSGHILPEAQTPLTLDGRPVGRLTSVARHFEDGPIALAVIKRNTPVDAVLDAAGTAVAQTTIVTP